MRASFLAPGILAIAGVALAACTTEQSSLPKELTTKLEAAFNRADAGACVALYMEDAEIIAEDAPAVRGRQAIEAYCTEQIAREIQLDTDTALSIVAGDLAVEQGTYRVRNVRIGADVEYGEYLHVWRRPAAGEWRIFRTMLNVTQSPQADVSVGGTE